MTRGELVEMLCNCAKDYCPGAAESIKRNSHMNNYRGEKFPQNLIDAIVVDFVNYVASKQCLDLGFYTKDLDENST